MGARHRKSIFYGPDRRADDLSDLLAVIALQIVQHHDFSLLNRQLPDHLAQLGSLCPPGASWLGELRDLIQGRLRLLTAQSAQKLPVGDPVQPGPQRAALIKGIQVAPGPDERLL